MSSILLTQAGLRRAAQASLRARAPASQRRGIITLKDHIYQIQATATGKGRDSAVQSGGDAPLELNFTVPKALGGKGGGPNPEQVFAMGYASCFLGALQLAASRAGQKEVGDRAKIHVTVKLGHPSDRDGLALGAKIEVEGVEDDAILKAAHDICPYSRALTHGAEVTVSKK